LPAAPNRASDEAQYYIRSLIFTQQLGPGDTLPPERELSRQLGIAPLTLRVALRALESDGFLTIKRGSKGGPRVVDADALAKCWLDWMQTRGNEIREIQEYSGLVEENIATLAVQRRTDEDLAALERAMQMPDDGSISVLTWHLDFHEAIARAAHNRPMHRAMKELRRELFIAVPLFSDPRQEDEFRRFQEIMFSAIRDRDLARALAAMREHSRHMNSQIVEGLPEDER
jgi:GntR family transcriptional repressor for pyruvate dehydrogenase complex